MIRTAAATATALALLVLPAGAVGAVAPERLVMPAAVLPAGYQPVPEETRAIPQAEALANSSTPRLRRLNERYRLSAYKALHRNRDVPEETESRAVVYRSPRGAALAYAEGIRVLEERATRVRLPGATAGAAYRVRQGTAEAVLAAWRRGPAILTLQVSREGAVPLGAVTRRVRSQDARARAVLARG